MFTPQERDSIHVWFYNRALDMGLTPEQRKEYFNIILYHAYKIARLDDTDQELGDIDIRTKFDALLAKQHSEIKELLING